MRRSLLATGMACAVAERALAMTIPLAAAHQGPPPSVRCARPKFFNSNGQTLRISATPQRRLQRLRCLGRRYHH
jgi:hypothetical protein